MDARVIVTVDCGTTSVAEVAAAGRLGIDVLITDHHAIPDVLPEAAALVNAHLPGSAYPDSRPLGRRNRLQAWPRPCWRRSRWVRSTHSASWIWPAIGSVADMVPIAGENRAILRLGLERLGHGDAARPCGAAARPPALIRPRVDAESIGYGIAPRINAVGRVGEALAAAQLLLAEDPAEVQRAGSGAGGRQHLRRELLATAMLEARTRGPG